MASHSDHDQHTATHTTTLSKSSTRTTTAPTLNPQDQESGSQRQKQDGDVGGHSHDHTASGAPATGAPTPSTILNGPELWLAFVGMLLSLFLVALDQTIVASALPVIVSHFHALDSVTWVSSAFILTQCALLPTVGQLCTLYIPKYIFLTSIVVFEAGSVLCAAAPNINALIAGRAVTGAGAAGLFVSLITLMSEMIVLEKRSTYMGMFGAVFGVSSVVGPLLGGAFTDHVTWRWCFWINLPFGGLAFAAVFLLVKTSVPVVMRQENKPTQWQRILYIDWLGTALILAAVTCLVLATTWGGGARGWGDGSVIACLVVAGVLTPVIIAWESHLGDKAMIVTRFFKNRSFSAIFASSLWSRALFIVPVYYLPINSEVVFNHSATKAGLDLLGLILTFVFASIVAGGTVRKFGRYKPFLVIGPLISCIGAGLLYTITPSTKLANIIGYEVLIGVGAGSCMQLLTLAAQAEFKSDPRNMGKVMGIVSFAGLLGGVIALAIAGGVFESLLGQNLRKYAPNVGNIAAQAPTSIRQYVSGTDLANVMLAYTQSLKYAYIIGVPVGAIAGIAAIFITDRNIALQPKSKDAAKKADVEKQASDESGANEGPAASDAEAKDADPTEASRH